MITKVGIALSFALSLPPIVLWGAECQAFKEGVVEVRDSDGLTLMATARSRSSGGDYESRSLAISQAEIKAKQILIRYQTHGKSSNGILSGVRRKNSCEDGLTVFVTVQTGPISRDAARNVKSGMKDSLSRTPTPTR